MEKKSSKKLVGIVLVGVAFTVVAGAMAQGHRLWDNNQTSSQAQGLSILGDDDNFWRNEQMKSGD